MISAKTREDLEYIRDNIVPKLDLTFDDMGCYDTCFAGQIVRDERFGGFDLKPDIAREAMQLGYQLSLNIAQDLYLFGIYDPEVIPMRLSHVLEGRV